MSLEELDLLACQVLRDHWGFLVLMDPLVRLALPVDLDQKEIEAQLVCQVKWGLLECLVDTDWMVCPVKKGTLALNLRMKCKWIAHERLPLRQQTLHLVPLVRPDLLVAAHGAGAGVLLPVPQVLPALVEVVSGANLVCCVLIIVNRRRIIKDR